MKLIPLRNQKGKIVGEAKVDDQDFVRFGGRRWYLSLQGYASSGTGSLHRLIMAAPVGMEVDHIDRNKLNNQRSNLRLVTPQQQRQNIPSRGKSKYRGVTYDSRPGALKKRWVATVKIDGRRVLHKRFSTELEAAEAAAEKRKEVMSHA